MNSGSCNLNQFSLDYIFYWSYADFWVINYKWWKIYLQSLVPQNVQHPISICAGTGRPNPDINDIMLSEEKNKPRLINKFLNANLIPSQKNPSEFMRTFQCDMCCISAFKWKADLALKQPNWLEKK